MPHVVIASSPMSAVVQMLGAPLFVRAQVDLSVAGSTVQGIAALHEREVDLVLLDLAAPGLDCLELLRAIRDEPALSGHAVVLVIPEPVSPALLSRIALAGHDGLLTWPLTDDELYEHIGQFIALPRRRQRRVEVHIPPATLRLDDGTEVQAEIQNLSSLGLCVLGGEGLERGADVTLRFPAGYALGAAQVPARVVWRQRGDRGVHLGLELGAVPREVQRALGQLTLWDVEERQDGTAEVAMEGEIDERAPLDLLAGRLSSAARIAFDLAGVTRMNSMGVRRWCSFLEGLPSACTITFRRCSISFATQMSMIPAVQGRGEVVSLRAPYHCTRCGCEVGRLLPAAVIQTAAALEPPRFRCSCGGQLVLDDLPERYFAFLRW